MTDGQAMTGNASPTGAEAIAVIVVEDDQDLREEVVDYLTGAGMAVRATSGGAALDRMLAEEPADAVVLDLGLPQEDGIAITRRLRTQDRPPGIIMMTARARVEERILGYETGADVYLVKPVDYGELVAALHAVVRHHRGGAAVGGSPSAPAWQLHLKSWRLAAPSGASLRLTWAETQALLCLSEEPGEPVTRDTIGQRMGKVADLGEHRYVDQIISRLRRKIANGLGWEAPIGSAHGQGYYFVGTILRSDD